MMKYSLLVGLLFALSACGSASDGGDGEDSGAPSAMAGSGQSASGGQSASEEGSSGGQSSVGDGGGAAAAGGTPSSGGVQPDLPWTEAGVIPTSIVYFIEAEAGAFFAGSYEKGLFRSVNNGDSWEKYGSGFPGGISVTALTSQNGDLFATTDKGIFKSIDEAATWELSTSKPSGNSTSLALATAPDAIYAVGQEGKIYRTSDGGENWTSSSLPTGYSIGDVDALSGMIYLAHSQQGAFVSDDSGASWEQVPGLGEGIVIGNAVEKAGDRLYLSLGSGAGSGLFETTGGAFTKVPGAAAGLLAAHGSDLLVSSETGVFAAESGSLPVDISANLPAAQFGGKIATDGSTILVGKDLGDEMQVYRRDY